MILRFDSNAELIVNKKGEILEELEVFVTQRPLVCETSVITNHTIHNSPY